MTRQWYETISDRQREQIIAKRFCEHWPVTPRWPRPLHPVKRTVDGYSIDYNAVDPDGVVLLRFEAKFRSHNFGHYNTLFISQNKVRAAYELWNVDDIPVFFAAGFRCGRFAYGDLCYPAEREVKCGGRYDRGDPYDEEWMVHIPIDQLKAF